jgi:hypothetical protein
MPATVHQLPSCEGEDDAEHTANSGSSMSGAMDGRAFTPPVSPFDAVNGSALSALRRARSVVLLST